MKLLYQEGLVGPESDYMAMEAWIKKIREQELPAKVLDNPLLQGIEDLQAVTSKNSVFFNKNGLFCPQAIRLCCFRGSGPIITRWKALNLLVFGIYDVAEYLGLVVPSQKRKFYII